MLLFLLACLPPPPDSALTAASGPSSVDRALALPESVPFPALVRAQPTTLVDERGQTLAVLESLGVAVTVIKTLPHRVLVDCTGCRAPVQGWLQRNTLLPLGVALDDDDLRADDQLLLWLHTNADEAQRGALSHGLVLVEFGRAAPPWYDEGGYGGPVVEVRQSGETWSVTTRAAAAEETLEEETPDAP